MIQGRQLRPIPAYYVLVCGDALFFSFAAAIMVVFQTSAAGLSPAQLLIVGAGWQTATLVSELPTGLVADTYGRRRSIIIGLVLTGCGCFIGGVVATFWVILFGAIVVGFGRTFLSGAQQAWIADEIGPERANAVYIRSSQLTMSMWVLAIPLSFAVATASIKLPMLLGGVSLAILGGFLFLTMTETGFVRSRPEELTSAWRQVRGTYADGLATLRLRPILFLIFGVAVFYGMAGQGFQTLWPTLFYENITFPDRFGVTDPLVWFGVIRTMAAILGVIALEVVRRNAEKRMRTGAGVTGALQVIDLMILASILMMALAGSFEMAAAGYALAFALSFAHDPFYIAWVNQNSDSRVRATVLSMGSQAEAVGRIGGGPPIGLVGSVFSVRAALALSGFAMAVPVFLYTRVRRERQLRVVASGE